MWSVSANHVSNDIIVWGVLPNKWSEPETIKLKPFDFLQIQAKLVYKI